MFTIFKLVGSAFAATRQVIRSVVTLAVVLVAGGSVLAAQNGHTFDEIVDRPAIAFEAWGETFGEDAASQP